jgi:sensor histidine kinase YesM
VKQVVTSIWFLAFIIAVPVILFFPPVFDKYNADLENTIHNSEKIYKIYFIDLDSDGVKEKVKCFPDANGRLSLHYFEDEGKNLIDQLNFPNQHYPDFSQIYFADVDENKFSEIYGFTISHDSLFLNWFEPYPNKNGLEHSKFVTKLGTYNKGKIDVDITDLYFSDLNLDGSIDLVFPVSSGYSLTPRNIFVFDVKNDTIYHSEYLGLNSFSLRFADLDGDSKPEIIADNAASGNLKDSLGNLHTDNVSVLQVFNSDLTPYFPTISFSKGLLSGVKNFIVGEEQQSILTFHYSENDSIKARFYLFNAKGEKTDSLLLPDRVKNQRHQLFQKHKNKYFIVEGKYLTRITADLEIVETSVLDVPETSSAKYLINYKGTKKQLVFEDIINNRITIFLEGLTRKIELNFEQRVSPFTKWNYLGNGKFYVLSGNSEYYYQLRKNNLFYLKYPGYLLIYFLTAAFIWLLQAARMRQLREKHELQNQVHELQLKSLKNQLDPHFMYNTFNTIASVIKQGRNDEAYDLFVIMSKMVRSNLDNSNEIYTTLKKEIDFVRNYLIIQKFRFKELFEFNIKIH